MMTKINKLILLLCLLCLNVSVFAASEAEYKKLAKTWTLNSDGSQEFRYQMELTLFTHTAMNSTYGESFIIYNPEYQVLKINSSYTQQKDGTIIQTPDNAFVECLPYSAENAPAYNHLKEMVVVHTGLELGATIYLDYTITTKAGYSPEIDIFEKILQTSPVKEYVLTIITPENKEVVYSLANNKAKASVQLSNGTRTTTWTLRNLPASSRNSFVSVANGDVPFLAATTYATKEEALATLFKQFNTADDLQLVTIAESLTENIDKDEDKLKAIHEYVSRQFDNSRVSLEHAAFRLRPANAILNTAYGTEIEKVNLLTGLLNGAGFTAEPVALYATDTEKGLALKAISQFFVSCQVNGENYLLSVTSTRRPQIVGTEQTPLFCLSTGAPLSFSPSKDSKIKSDITITIKEGKVTTAVKESVGKDLLPYFTEGKQESKTTEPLTIQNGYATLLLPDAKQGISHLPYTRLNSERKENLSIPRLVDESYTYTVECPTNIKLQTPETSKSYQNTAGSFTFSVKKTGQSATITRSLKLNKQLYTPAEYKDLRLLLTEWNNISGKTLLFSVQ